MAYANEQMARQQGELKEGLNQAASRAEQTFDQAKNYVEDKAQSAKRTAEGVVNEASSKLSNAVDKTITTVNDGIEAGKRIIADQHLDKVAEDVSGVIKKYPVQALFCGIGVGLLIGNLMSRT